MSKQLVEIILCPTCESVHSSEDFTSLDYYYDGETADNAYEVISTIPFNASRDEIGYRCDCTACGQDGRGYAEYSWLEDKK